MKNTSKSKTPTLNELNEKYKDAPCRISEYEIDGNKYIVKSHFIGDKDINEVLYNLSFQRALRETLETA